MSLYINGGLVVDAGGQPNPNVLNDQLANLNDVNNWLGRSNWTADSNFGGSFDEFRVYDNAQTATEVGADFVLGEDIVATNVVSLQVNRANGEIKLKNNVNVALPIEYYDINSAGGALSTSGWTSVDGNTAPGAGWDKAGGANANFLSELNLTEAGFSFPALGELTIGSAYNSSIFGNGPGDLSFTIGHIAGAVLSGSVEYIGVAPVGGVAGDYNDNDVVDAADYTIWRNHLNQTFQLQNEGGISPGVVDAADYAFWKSRFGATSGSGAGAASDAAVPEPVAMVLFACGLLGIGSRRRRTSFNTPQLIAPGWNSSIHQGMDQRHAMSANVRSCGWTRTVVALLAGFMLATSSHAAATVDRFYQFGDDPTENPADGITPTTDFGQFTGDTKGTTTDFQDLSYGAQGAPVYIHTTARPGGAGAAEWGLNFNGTSTSMVRQNGGLGSPAIGDDEASYVGVLNYAGITTRLMEAWVRPTNLALGRQDVVNDTAQFGIFISADDRWGFVEGATTVTSTTQVVLNAWTHVQHRTFTNTAAILYVDGVAVAGTTSDYNTGFAAGNIVYGANLNQSANFFQGQIDNSVIAVSGNNTAQGGQNYGEVDLRTDNDFIRQRLIGKPVGDVDLSGAVGPNDVTVFVANWLKTKQVGGVTTGDMTTRMIGDLNLNGTVDIDDAFALHQGLSAAGMGGLDFSLLGAGVPEPSSFVLVAWCTLAGGASFGRRRGRARS